MHRFSGKKFNDFKDQKHIDFEFTRSLFFVTGIIQGFSSKKKQIMKLGGDISSMAEQYAATKKTAFWIASILCVLLAIHVVASTHVTHYDTTDLGLLTKLPITFWIGLSFLGILLYVSRKSERRTVIVVALISSYLFGIPVLIRENKAEWLMLSYRLSSQGVHLLSEGHLALGSLNPWDFRNWPGFFYFTAFISSSTGLPATALSDYFPLITIALLGVFTYSILRLRLNTLHSSLGALWFIGSFWTSQHYFSPQGFAYVIYFAIVLLLAKLFFTKNNQGIAFPLSIIFMFTATVASHFLTSFMILGSVVAIYTLYKILPLKVKIHPFYSIATSLLLASIFFSYQLVVVPLSFSDIIEVLIKELSRQETHLSYISQTRIIGSTSYLLELVGTYSITIINVVIVIFAILTTAWGLLFHKKETKHDVFWIALIIVAGVFGVSMKYGGYEAIQRSFMFMLLPACYFSIKFLSKKPRILILLLLILVFIHIPAVYSAEMFMMVPTSEFKGIAFRAEYVPPDAPFFYSLPGGEGKQISIFGSLWFPHMSSLPSPELVKKTIRGAEFIMSSNLQKNFYLYFFGVDPLENLNFDDRNSRIYDNEGFRIYARAFLSPNP